MIRFVHTADVHFGMENYGKIDPATGIHTRLLDFNHAFNYCIDYAIKHTVDFFLFCGDAYKTAHPSPTQQKLLLKSLLKLYQAGIPVVIVIGNHDHPISSGKANTLDLFSELPVNGFYVISKPQAITLNTMNGPINIVGIPWPTRNTITIHGAYNAQSAHEITTTISRVVTETIKQIALKLDQNVPAILAAHLTVASGVFSGSEKRAIYGTDPLFFVSDLAINPFDYVALGHLHRHQNLNLHGYPAVVYSGSIERVDFGERKEEKGFCDVIIHEKNKCTFNFIPTPTRTFIQIEETLTPNKDHTKHLIDAISRHTIKDAIIKIIYHVPMGIEDMVDIKQIQRACQHAMQLISITPVHTRSYREKRILNSNLSKDNLPALFEALLDQKPEWYGKKNQLLKKLDLLIHEQQESEEKK